MLINSQVLSGKQLDYPILCFEKSRVLEKTIFANIREISPNLSFEEIPSIVIFTGNQNGRGVHIGSKMSIVTSNILMKIMRQRSILEGSLVICARAKSGFLRVTDSKQRLKTGIVFEIKPIHLIVLSNSDCKKMLSNTVQSIYIELHTERGQLVPFSGTRKVILTIQFRTFSG